MMKQLREVRYFLLSQHFAEGLRITFAILLPSVLLSYYGRMETGLAISLGALCVSITDSPGPAVHRRHGMLYCIGVLFITTIITGFAQMNVYTLGAAVVFGSFLFSMFNVYGMRAAAVGSAGLLVMILNMDKPTDGPAALINALLVAGGGTWYLCISLLSSALRPYHLPRRLLGDCMRELAAFLALKARFYDSTSDLAEGYRKLVAQQILVHEKQDAVREILFKTRQIVKESTPQGRTLVFLFVESVDLFEDITATYYDYSILRKRYGSVGILPEISQLIKELSDELDRIGFAIQANEPVVGSPDFEGKLSLLRVRLDSVAVGEDSSTFLLKKIVVNLRRLIKRITMLRNAAGGVELPVQKGKLDHHRFIDHQSFTKQVLTDNLNFNSSLFRHALRTAAVCLVGFVLTKALSYGQHSYWILLTIAFIMKPAYSLTKQRNIERIAGTIGGGLLGVGILLLVKDSQVLFVFLVLFMLGTYSFLRVNYLVMVSCVTPLVLILFHFLGLGYISIVQERIVDTAIGCLIAFTASYLFLPKWESEQLSGQLQKMIQANLGYLQTVVRPLYGKKVATVDYKLARKEVYVQSANLSAAFQRMLSEPKGKQKNAKLVHQFVVLNHILFSNVAAIGASLGSKEPRQYSEEVLHPVRRAIGVLNKTLKKTDDYSTVTGSVREAGAGQPEWTMDDRLLKEQFEFVDKVSADISRITVEIGGISGIDQPGIR
ncbi:MAG TPA: FUSC family membrane protein [Flavisolibacter sp.]|jgi:uncharacterized membrane protein YccC|nr:FUSC family membrane protein [Flavisolibacter sp.]